MTKELEAAREAIVKRLLAGDAPIYLHEYKDAPENVRDRFREFVDTMFALPEVRGLLAHEQEVEAKPEPRSALGAEGPNPTVTPTLHGEGVEGSEGKGEP